MPVLQPIKYRTGELQLLDQRLLPLEVEYLQVKTCEDAHQRIREMAVRGAPAIAIAGVLALAVELHSSGESTGFASAAAAADGISARLDYLVTRCSSLNLPTSLAMCHIVASQELPPAPDHQSCCCKQSCATELARDLTCLPQ